MEFSFKLKVNAPKEKIWDYYSDIQRWYMWEENLEDITLHGNFEAGNTGMMKLKNMPKVEYTLTNVIINQRFCDETVMPFGTIYFDHQILEETDGVYIRHAVGLDTQEANKEVLGILRQIFSDVPDTVMKLKTEVEL